MGQSGTEQSNLARNTFVGRERELAELVSACASGADSDAHLFLISGEPGIGKTRLADELASRAKARGVQVLWGRCWEVGGAPAYWPWIQVIRSFLDALDLERRKLVLESEVASDIIQQVARIVPEMRPAQSSFRPPRSDKLEPIEARFRLFDSVTSFLKIGARSNPILIVLDDLHDADEASLVMLRFMARELKGAAILIVATCREAEVRRSSNLSKLIGEISREARAIPMSGLSETEVRKFVQDGAGRTPDDALVAKLCAATNGNPLFLDGIVRILIAERTIDSAGAPGRPLKFPIGVREAIRGRLGGLSTEANSLLVVAAAIGIEFELNLCSGVADVSAGEAHRLLDEASSAGIVTKLDNGRYRFCHALVRAAVYDGIDTTSRARIHGKIAERLDKIYRENLDPHVAELAHHYREAGVMEKAIDYSIRAGQAAAKVFAYADATVHAQAALELMEQQGADALKRADLLHQLGRIAFHVDLQLSLKYGEAAIALYESIGRFDKAAHAHILLGTIFHMRGEPQFNAALASEHLRRAESVMANGPQSVFLADLYHVIAANECHLLNVTESARAARRSMEISDRLDDKSFWPGATAFYAWSLVMGGQLGEGFALYERAFEAAIEANVPCLATAWGAGTLSSWLGDPRRAREWYERELRRMGKEAAPIAHQTLSNAISGTYSYEGQLREARWRLAPDDPWFRYWVAGEWEAMTALAEKNGEASGRAGDRIMALGWSRVAGRAYMFLGEYARAEANLNYGLDNGECGPVVLLEMRARPLLARVYVAMNRLDEAVEQVARCLQIMAAGEDWRGLAGEVACAQGVIAGARGDHETACRHIESAFAIQQRFQLAADQAETLLYWGLTLAGAGDRASAAEKIDSAIEISRSRGVGPRLLEWLAAEKIRALEGRPTYSGVGSRSRPESANSNSTRAFRREGEFWTITYGGATFRLKDAKGLRYVAYLLERPGQRIHVHDLIEAVEGCAANRRTIIHAKSENLEIARNIGDAGPTLDARARSEYRIRLRDLHADLEESERMNDLGRAERIRTEIEMVEGELTRSSGLGGRARSASISVERARGLVGKNIRSVLQKIHHEHPALGRYFIATIITGNFCAYQPEPDQTISWQF